VLDCILNENIIIIILYCQVQNTLTYISISIQVKGSKFNTLDALMKLSIHGSCSACTRINLELIITVYKCLELFLSH